MKKNNNSQTETLYLLPPDLTVLSDLPLINSLINISIKLSKPIIHRRNKIIIISN